MRAASRRAAPPRKPPGRAGERSAKVLAPCCERPEPPRLVTARMPEPAGPEYLPEFHGASSSSRSRLLSILPSPLNGLPCPQFPTALRSGGCKPPCTPRHATRPCGTVRFKAAARRLRRCPTGSLEPASPARHADDAPPRWRGEWLGHSPRVLESPLKAWRYFAASGRGDDADVMRTGVRGPASSGPSILLPAPPFAVPPCDEHTTAARASSQETAQAARGGLAHYRRSHLSALAPYVTKRRDCHFSLETRAVPL